MEKFSKKHISLCRRVGFLEIVTVWWHLKLSWLIVVAITFYSSSCLGLKTTTGPFGLRVKLPPAHLSTTHSGGFTLSL